MPKQIIKLFLSALFLLIISGCSKDIDEYNKPAIYWYSKMIESISKNDLDRADNYYSSLQSEHIGSPLLPEATFIMALAHMYNEEYLLADHYLDEYVRRFADDASNKEEAEFLKIKAKYLSLPNPRRDQALIDEAIAEARSFKRHYPNSIHYYVVDTILTRLLLSKAVLDEAIASLYKRIDKPKAAKFYQSKIPEKWIDWSRVKRAQTPWYREWFEGDGTSSWYAFLIPDTQSVVSRNSIQDINITKEVYDETK
ncbi:Putative lipoprotein [hydrothermal vent metagenome]|uniref:Putative lipoprotein n=1 Tax=hydrothermal vent metagenome TaxID=652676 RepID=A0A1W1BWC6_9ZZZZ